MRDRLIELIKQAKKQTKNANCDIERNMIFADYLLANGVIVPPCKVGDVLYYIPFGNNIVECKVAEITIEPHTEIGMSFHCYGGFVFDMRDWGNYVFLTREEAEAALKGGEEK